MDLRTITPTKRQLRELGELAEIDYCYQENGFYFFQKRNYPAYEFSVYKLKHEDLELRNVKLMVKHGITRK